MRSITRILIAALVVFSLVGDANGQATEVVVRGDTISYATFGAGSTTLLLVHGWSNNRTFWEPHVRTLSQRYELVIPDLAGFGESTAHRSVWSMASFADDLEGVLDAIESQSVVLVGFSMAGAVALELAARARDDVIGVVLVDMFLDVEAAPSDEEIDRILRDARANWRDAKSLSGALSRAASPTLVRRYQSRTPQDVPPHWWVSLRDLFVWYRDALRPTLARVDVPIRAINSDREPTTNEAWQRHAPGFSAHIIPGVNHLGTIWERVDEFDEALTVFVREFESRK